MDPICSECDRELVDVNEGFAGLRWGPPAFECQTPGCPRNPNCEVNDIELLEEEPPDEPAIHMSLALFPRGTEREWLLSHGYRRAYLWTNQGTRVMTYLFSDKIEGGR